MNDDQLMTAVRDSFAEVRLDVPVEQTARRGRRLRGRGRAYRVAGVVGAAAIAGLTAVAVTGPGRAAPPTASAHVGASGVPIATGSGGTTLDAWTVTKGSGGTVNVTIRELLDVPGLQRTLRADGVPARVVVQPGMPTDAPSVLPAGCLEVTMSDVANANLQAKILAAPLSNLADGNALTIHTRDIPAGVGIYLGIQPRTKEHWGWSLDLVQATPACTG
jgi:hypothetical protein